jgi:hypothetical protein
MSHKDGWQQITNPGLAPELPKGMEAIPPHRVPSDGDPVERIVASRQGASVAAVAVGTQRTMIDSGLPPPGEHFIAFDVGHVRQAIEAYDRVRANAIEEDIRSVSKTLEPSRVIGWGRGAATGIVVQRARITSSHKEETIRPAYPIHLVEQELLEVLLYRHGLPMPAEDDRVWHPEASVTLGDKLWAGNDDPYQIAAQLLWYYIDKQPYGPCSDRLGWYLMNWVLLVSDIGHLPRHDLDTYHYELNDKATLLNSTEFWQWLKIKFGSYWNPEFRPAYNRWLTENP